MLFANFGGSMYEGVRRNRDKIQGEQREVADAMRQFAKDNPYATEEELREYAKTLAGRDRYLRSPSTQGIGAMAETNKRNRDKRDLDTRIGRAEAWNQLLSMHPDASADELAQLSDEWFQGQDHGFNSPESIARLVDRRERAAARERLQEDLADSQARAALEARNRQSLYQAWTEGRDVRSAAEMIAQSTKDASGGLMDQMTDDWLATVDPDKLGMQFANEAVEDAIRNGKLGMVLDEMSAREEMPTMEEIAAKGGLPPALQDSPFVKYLIESRYKAKRQEYLEYQYRRRSQVASEESRVAAALRQLGANTYLTSDSIATDPDVVYARDVLGWTDDAINNLLQQGGLNTNQAMMTQTLQGAITAQSELIQGQSDNFQEVYGLLGDSLTAPQQQFIYGLRGYHVPRAAFPIIDAVLAETKGKKFDQTTIRQMVEDRMGAEFQTVAQAASSAASSRVSALGQDGGVLYSDPYVERLAGTADTPGEVRTRVREVRQDLGQLLLAVPETSAEATRIQMDILGNEATGTPGVIAIIDAEIQQLIQEEARAHNEALFMQRVGSDSVGEQQRRIQILVPELQRARTELESLKQNLIQKANDMAGEEQAIINAEAEQRQAANEQETRRRVENIESQWKVPDYAIIPQQ